MVNKIITLIISKNNFIFFIAYNILFSLMFNDNNLLLNFYMKENTLLLNDFHRVLINFFMD